MLYIFVASFLVSPHLLMTSSTPISSFAKPVAPPPPVVVVLDATELYTHPPTSLLAFEDLKPSSFKKSPIRATTKRARFHPYNPEEARVPPLHRQPTPRPTPPRTTSQQVSGGDAPAIDADISPLTSPASSPRSSPIPDDSRPSFGVVSTKLTIKRPKGAARKNLQEQVKWDPAFMAEVKVFHLVSWLYLSLCG